VLILRGLPCEVALHRGLLWHSWLKNQVLKMDSGYVVQMHRRPSLKEERESFERKIQAGGEFESNLTNARKLVGNMVHGFSPTQLIESGSFATLSAEAHEVIKSVIHKEYLRQTRIEEYVEPASDAINELEDAYKEFAIAWYQKPPVSDKVIQQCFELLQCRARKLHELLGRLPEGIVLP